MCALTDQRPCLPRPAPAAHVYAGMTAARLDEIFEEVGCACFVYAGMHLCVHACVSAWESSHAHAHSYRAVYVRCMQQCFMDAILL
jgi:hypothetical protein